MENLNKNMKIECFEDASSEQEIKEMIEKSKITIPKDYIEIIQNKSEIEIRVSGKKIIRIWGAVGCIEMNEAYNIQKYLPNTWAIGDDEGGNAIIYSNGKHGFGIYAVSFNDLEEDEKTFIAPSLYDFFVNGIGVNNFIEL